MQTNTEEKNIGKKDKGYTDEFRRSVVAHWLERGKLRFFVGLTNREIAELLASPREPWHGGFPQPGPSQGSRRYSCA
jgi:hypothetical protein